jgi:GT2 family glycosyltransferase
MAEAGQLMEVETAAQTRTVDLSIVVVTWNSERWIERCLASIPAACGGCSYEVVIYDNASSDRTLQLVSGDARVIRGDSNAGFAGGTNRGIEHSTGRYLFLLNPDCELAPGALTNLMDYLDDHSAVAAAAPLLIDDDGGSQREFQLRRLPTLRTLLGEIFGIGKLFPANRATARYRYRDLVLDEPRVIEQPAAAALLLRREVFDEIGPFDERFAPAWFEDVDYCRRLAAAHKTVMVVPAARAQHFGGSSLEHVSFERFADVWYRNMWLYARKWFSGGQAELVRWAIVVAMMLRVPAAIAGIAHRDHGRLRVARAYARVARHAVRRWDLSPASS